MDRFSVSTAPDSLWDSSAAASRHSSMASRPITATEDISFSVLSPKQQPALGHTAIAIVCWYIASIVATKATYNALNEYSCTGCITFCQHFIGGVLGLIYMRVSPSKSMITRSLLPHVLLLGLNLATISLTYNTAMNYVPVSLLNTVKATIPLWTCLCCHVYYGSRYSRVTYLSLLPIVFGVTLASYNDSNVNTIGILLASVSALAQTGYNLYIKQILETTSVDSITLLVLSACTSSATLSPVWIYSGPPLSTLSASIPMAGVAWFIEFMLSVRVISALGPLGYSVADVVRRLVVIVSSIIIFRNNVSLLNLLGILISFMGVAVYNLSQYKASRKHVA